VILKAGELFPRFRVLGLGRDVALKFVTQAGEYNSELSDRLKRETMSLAALSHPSFTGLRRRPGLHCYGAGSLVKEKL